MHDNTGSGSGNARIVEYWNRRGRGLDKKEWEDFYRLMVPVLLRTKLPSDYNDERKRLELVNDFFQDKVLLNAATTTAGPLQTAYALHSFLKNYERERRPDDFPPQPPDEEPAAAEASPGYERLLIEAGIDLARAMHSADQFVADLDDGDAAFLRSHSCADGKAEPMSSIAERTRMGTAWHHRAKRLGITRSKGETYRGYEHTTIGRWLLAAGARLHPDWREEVAALLMVLCQRVRLYRGRTV